MHILRCLPRRCTIVHVLLLWLSVVGLGLLVSTATAQWWGASPVLETLPEGQVDWTVGAVRSQARGDAGPQGRAAAAYAVALQTAQQRLLAALEHLRLDAERTVGMVLRTSAEAQQKLAMLVAEASVDQTRYLPRDTVEVTVQLGLAGPFTALLWPANGSVPAAVETSEDAGYTGIVIDARGLGLQQALFPEVVGEDGQTLYAPARVNATAAIQRGYMVYTNAPDHPQVATRVGEHPLVILARRTVGEERVNILIRQTDADRLQQSPALQRLLERCLVLIVG